MSSLITNSDFAEVSIVGIHDALPGDGSWVNVQASEARDFFLAQRIAVSLRDAQFHQTLEEKWGGKNEPRVEGSMVVS